MRLRLQEQRELAVVGFVLAVPALLADPVLEVADSAGLAARVGSEAPVGSAPVGSVDQVSSDSDRLRPLERELMLLV